MLHTCAVVVAAGRSERFGGRVPKLLVPWRGRPLLAWTLDAFERCGAVEDVVVVASEAVRAATGLFDRASKVRAVVSGGSTRQASVLAGVAAAPEAAELLLVHDGARPFVSPDLIERVIRAAASAGAAVPLLAVADTVKSVDAAGDVAATIPRDQLRLAQTPQGFRREVLLAAARHVRDAGLLLTDDVAAVEAALAAGRLPGIRVAGIQGEPGNVKVTSPSDLAVAGAGAVPGAWRVGLGHDVHPLERGRPFRLAGVDVQPGADPGERFGPRGHSDGDALTHAACDALLGAAGLGDIGRHFPDTAAENAGRASLDFLRRVVALLAERGLRPGNLSAVVQLERPRLAPHVDAIRASLAEVLGLEPERVGLSAKRGEGLGPVGEGLAIVADVVALVEPLP